MAQSRSCSRSHRRRTLLSLGLVCLSFLFPFANALHSTRPTGPSRRAEPSDQDRIDEENALTPPASFLQSSTLSPDTKLHASGSGIGVRGVKPGSPENGVALSPVSFVEKGLFDVVNPELGSGDAEELDWQAQNRDHPNNEQGDETQGKGDTDEAGGLRSRNPWELVDRADEEGRGQNGDTDSVSALQTKGSTGTGTGVYKGQAVSVNAKYVDDAMTGGIHIRFNDMNTTELQRRVLIKNTTGQTLKIFIRTTDSAFTPEKADVFEELPHARPPPSRFGWATRAVNSLSAMVFGETDDDEPKENAAKELTTVDALSKQYARHVRKNRGIPGELIVDLARYTEAADMKDCPLPQGSLAKSAARDVVSILLTDDGKRRVDELRQKMALLFELPPKNVEVLENTGHVICTLPPEKVQQEKLKALLEYVRDLFGCQIQHWSFSEVMSLRSAVPLDDDPPHSYLTEQTRTLSAGQESFPTIEPRPPIRSSPRFPSYPSPSFPTFPSPSLPRYPSPSFPTVPSPSLPTTPEFPSTPPRQPAPRTPSPMTPPSSESPSTPSPRQPSPRTPIMPRQPIRPSPPVSRPVYPKFPEAGPVFPTPGKVPRNGAFPRLPVGGGFTGTLPPRFGGGGGGGRILPPTGPTGDGGRARLPPSSPVGGGGSGGISPRPPIGGGGGISPRPPVGGGGGTSPTLPIGGDGRDRSPQPRTPTPRAPADLNPEIPQAPSGPASDFHGSLPREDSLATKLYGMHMLKISSAWLHGERGQGAVVAVVDSGVDDHPDLRCNFWRNSGEKRDGRDDDGNGLVDDLRGYNFDSNRGEPDDLNGHGTHVAGTIAACDDGQGVVGGAPAARLMGLRFMDHKGAGATSEGIRSLEYALRMGAHVVNNSWGGPSESQGLHRMVKMTRAARNGKGMLLLNAAGNESVNNDIVKSYPTCFDQDNTISVAAVDVHGKLAGFSNYGRHSVDLAAPGVKIYSTMPRLSYQFLSGTSMATPHVSAVAALVFGAFLRNGYDAPAAEVKDVIRITARPLQSVERVTRWGTMPDAQDAVLMARMGGMWIQADCQNMIFELPPQGVHVVKMTLRGYKAGVFVTHVTFDVFDSTGKRLDRVDVPMTLHVSSNPNANKHSDSEAASAFSDVRSSDNARPAEGFEDLCRVQARLKEEPEGLSTAAVIGIVVGCIAAVATILVAIFLWRRSVKRRAASGAGGKKARSHDDAAAPLAATNEE
ncbi:subtilisin-like protease [Cystoisospora suis]|uniref:subtilisin n=1 Tax=Cystoisospora suis TaxID=483139 RepID=A0A2C6L4C4_9APIC|nr:subtilisin-like protease [Cystoisospora suis]